MKSIRLIKIAGIFGLILSASVAMAEGDLVGEVKLSSRLQPADLIIYLVNPPAASKPTQSPMAVMDQRNQTYHPRVLAIVKGTTVKFLNSDRVVHNVFSLSPTKAFDLGKIAPDQFGLVTFEKPGVVEVLCGFHSRMLGYIRVMEHRYFAIPDAQGRFIIKGVPLGAYQLRIWHEGLGEVSKEVKVTAERSVPIQLSFPR